MVVKTETCSFSGLRIYPGHGRKFVRVDMKVFTFLNGKCRSYFHQRLNPRKLDWTVFFRRLHKKGTHADEAIKRKSRKTVRYQKAIVGASLDQIKEKRNQKPEVRQAARDAAKREASEKKKARSTKVKHQGGQSMKVAQNRKAGPAKTSQR
mmetsp:Transcript_46794/g.120598  ORF Transcript_46794/g.120598 Transcript_46794/m.120598 type:complete len:151 (-) Transcript_46794:79-531(-)